MSERAAPTLGPDDFLAVADLIAQYGSVANITAELYAKRPKRREPWTRDQVMKAYEFKLITRVEARKLLGVRTTR